MPQLKELNSQSWDDRLEARAHTYQLRGRFKFACERLVERQPQRWLDIGTGNGFLPKTARPFLGNVHITGTDFAPNALEAAGNALDEGIVNDLDREELPFEDQSFDFVTCLEVLEHFIFPQNALREIRRVLKPQGYLVLTVPNLQFVEYLGQLIRGKMPGPASDTRHMSVFTHRFLEKMLMECSFQQTMRSGCEASPEWFSRVSRRYFCRTIAVEAQRQ